ncbi:cytochrome P450 [Streptomyces sp. G45]|uniref:cytochrome P450 n=1 Tax=Streptomyces sp. G45 TaxID=3406627 RepID=UPI003C2A0A09
MDLAHPLLRLDEYAADVPAQGHRIRALGPLVPVELPGSVRAWATADHAVANAVFRTRGFVKNPRLWSAYRDGELPDGWPLLRLVAVDSMLTKDGADHRRLSTLVGRAFTPRRVARLRPRVEDLTAELIEGLALAAPAGPVDLRRCFAFHLPLRVLCELFGLTDPVDRQRLADLYGALHHRHVTAADAQAADTGIREALDALAAAKSVTPGDDLTSALIEAHDAADTPLSARELVDTLVLFLVAGHETTQNLITNAARNLLDHPGQLALARQGAAGSDWSGVVEETLRRDCPVHTVMFRYAATDLEVPGTGVTVRAGEPVLVHLAATGRDHAQFGPGADAFDVTRADADQHLAFARGAHYCVGAPLARLMAGTALHALFTSFDVTRTDLDAPMPLPGRAANSVRALPVTLAPRLVCLPVGGA